MATIRMVAITGDTAASSFRMMLFMVLSSCGLRRHLVTGEPTLLNVSWLIFEVENEFMGAPAARGKETIPEGARRGRDGRHPVAKTPTSRASADTSTSMFGLHSCSHSCMERI